MAKKLNGKLEKGSSKIKAKAKLETENDLQKNSIIIDPDEERRNEELYRFIDEFIASEEYQNYLERKSGLNLQSRETQCDEEDLKEEKLLYPLTEKFEKVFLFEKQFNNHLRKIEVERLCEGQERGIEIIKAKIADARRFFLCHQKERIRLKRENFIDTVNRFCEENNIQVSVKAPHKELIRKAAYDASKRMKINYAQREENVKNIIRKLVRENERQKQINKTLNKTYDYKVKKKEWIIKDMVVRGNKIQLLSRPEKEDVKEGEDDGYVTEPEPLEEEPIKLIEENSKKNKKNKSQKSKKSSKMSSKKSVISSKASTKDKKNKNKSKKSKKDKSEVEEPFTLPYIPIINPRKKIAPDFEKMKDLLQGFDFFEEVLENRKMLHTLYEDIHNYPEDYSFICNKPEISFDGYSNNKIYKRIIIITNKKPIVRKIRYWKTSFENAYDSTLFQVEPVGVQKVYPGSCFKMYVKFCSPQSKIVKGEISFLTYDVHDFTYGIFKIPIECKPETATVEITPAKIVFSRIPIWKIKSNRRGKLRRPLMITNLSNKICTIEIRKLYNHVSESYLYDYLNSVQSDEEMNNYVNKNGTLHESIEEEIDDSILESPSYSQDIKSNTFEFDKMYLELEGQSGQKIWVNLKTIEHTGLFDDKYLINIYQKNENSNHTLIGSKEIYVSAEVTGHLLKAEPDQLDFGVCAVNTTYQVSFQITNTGNSIAGISVKFPTNMKEYLSSSVVSTVLSGNEKRVIYIKFTPRKSIMIDYNSYYDQETSILQFPIHVNVSSKELRDVPLKITIYAIVTDPADIYLEHPCSEPGSTCAGTVDLGECTIYETIYTDIYVVNNCYLKQHFYFPNLPECITISPNYGFTEIQPFEKRLLRLYLMPANEDYQEPDLNLSAPFEFTLRLDAVERCKEIKQHINQKRLRKSFDTIQKELIRQHDVSLINDIVSCVSATKAMLSSQEDYFGTEDEPATSEDKQNEIFQHSFISDIGSNYNDQQDPESTSLSEEGEERNEGEEQSLQIDYTCCEGNKPPLFTQLHLTASIIRPLCDFSHHHVEFPPTPCGSYSVMTVNIEAFYTPGSSSSCVCGFGKARKTREQTACRIDFEIIGDNPEIRMESYCGSLRSGESLKLTLVAKPEIPEQIIIEEAERQQYLKLIDAKRQELEEKRLKELEKNKMKQSIKKERGKSKVKKLGGKKDSNKGSKESKGKQTKRGKKVKEDAIKDDIKETPAGDEMQPLPEIIIDKNEIIVDYVDLYPAEMNLWRNFEQQTILAQFTCSLKYKCDHITRKNDRIFLTAACKVIRPDFVHNLDIQQIDFGPVAMGDSQRRIISLKNINCTKIKPKISYFQPNGCLSSPHIDNFLTPDCEMKIPITIRPNQECEIKEYIEITAGRTVCPLLITGEGVEANITISPNFQVIRLETNDDSYKDYSVEVDNSSRANVRIRFEKVCEIQGKIQQIVKPHASNHKVNKTDKKKHGKKGSHDKQSKGNQKTKNKKATHSNELTTDEIAAISESFNKVEGESYFDCIGDVKDSNVIEIDPSSKKVMSIRFGTPKAILESKLEESGMDKKKGKKGRRNKEKTGSKSSKSSRKSVKKKNNPADEMYHIVKFNILLGSTYLRDIIVIAKFL